MYINNCARRRRCMCRLTVSTACTTCMYSLHVDHCVLGACSELCVKVCVQAHSEHCLHYMYVLIAC